MSMTQYVVVVTDSEGSVCSLLGPRNDEIDARAIRDVIRREKGGEAVVMPLREPDTSDLHAAGVYRGAAS